MVSIYKSGGVDLDDIFEPRGATPAGPNVIYSFNGQNLADRYKPLGAETPAAPVVYSSGGSNLSDLFAPFGSAPFWPPVPPYNDTFDANALSTGNQTATADIQLQFLTDGTFRWIRTITENGAAPVVTTSTPENFLPVGVNPLDVELQAVQSTGPTADQNDLTSFVGLGTQRNIQHAISSTGGGGTFDALLVFDITIRLIADPGNNSTKAATIFVQATSEA